MQLPAVPRLHKTKSMRLTKCCFSHGFWGAVVQQGLTPVSLCPSFSLPHEGAPLPGMSLLPLSVPKCTGGFPCSRCPVRAW